MDAYLAIAKSRLPDHIWQYLSQGDEGHNQRAFEKIGLIPRPLRNLKHGHTRLSLFGEALEHPLLLAPVAYQKLFHPQGEIASASAAAAQGGQMLISSLASEPFESIVQAARQCGGHAPWFQLYWQGSRQETLRLLLQALEAGCKVVVFTVDAPVKVSTLQLPAHVQAVNLNTAPPVPHGAGAFQGWMQHAPTWEDLIWLRKQFELPLVIKGLMHPHDAQQAIEAGCDGIVVSNHGGRVLKGTVSSLDALSDIARAVQGRVPLLLDGGVRSGRDAFVALTKGASAVLMGRPFVWGLSSHGAMGVAQVIRLMRDELEMTMALTGCAHLTDIEHPTGKT